MKESGLISKIRSGKGILEPIRGKISIDKVKSYPLLSGSIYKGTVYMFMMNMI